MSKAYERVVFVVYAAAVYEAAVSANELTRVQDELGLLVKVLEKDARLRRFFETPTIPFQAKCALVEDALQGFALCTRNLLKTLMLRERMVEFAGIVAELSHHANRMAGFAEVEVESAAPLDETQLRRLRELMEKKLSHRVRLIEQVRAELLGGLILRHDDRQWNASLLYRLRRMMRAAEELKGSHGAWSE